MMKFKEEYGHMILRISMALVFLSFGIMQIYAPVQWLGFLPSFLANTSSPSIFVLLNGSMEVFLGLLLLFGLYIRIASLILGLHLLIIATTLGFSPLGIRDFGLALATLSLVFFNPDKYCLDKKRKKKN